MAPRLQIEPHASPALTLESHHPQYGYRDGPVQAVRTDLTANPKGQPGWRIHTGLSHLMQAKDHAGNAVRLLCAAEEALRHCAQNAQQAVGHEDLNTEATDPLMTALAKAAWDAQGLLAPVRASFNPATPALENA